MTAKSEPSVAASKASGPAEPGLIDGRVWIGLLFLFLIGVGMNQRLNVLLDGYFRQSVSPAGAREPWQLGGEATVAVTLITADADRLACAHEASIEGVHCALTAARRPWPADPDAPLDDNGARTIQPYRTADTNALIFIAGLWNQPELALRRHREPPEHYPVKKLLRFTAYCRVTFIGELKDAAVRWNTRATWEPNQSALVARPLRCSLNAP